MRPNREENTAIISGIIELFATLNYTRASQFQLHAKKSGYVARLTISYLILGKGVPPNPQNSHEEFTSQNPNSFGYGETADEAISDLWQKLMEGTLIVSYKENKYILRYDEHKKFDKKIFEVHDGALKEYTILKRVKVTGSHATIPQNTVVEVISETAERYTGMYQGIKRQILKNLCEGTCCIIELPDVQAAFFISGISTRVE